MKKRVALYLRVSTKGQSVENQRRELEAVAAHRGWDVVATYQDAGISGAKGRDKRPGFDRLLKDATRRQFDLIARLVGRSVGPVATGPCCLTRRTSCRRGRSLSASASGRYHDAGRQSAVPDDGRVRGVRAGDDPRAHQCRAGAHQGEGHQAGAAAGRAVRRGAHPHAAGGRHGDAQDRARAGDRDQCRAARRCIRN